MKGTVKKALNLLRTLQSEQMKYTLTQENT